MCSAIFKFLYTIRKELIASGFHVKQLGYRQLFAAQKISGDKPMSVETLGGARGAGGGLRLFSAIAAIIRTARAALASHRAMSELDGLTDHYLRDVGIERRNVPELVKREVAREQLLGVGWRTSPRR
jgi:uncharacterized protein YjiS (DUF1127 family)